MIELDYIREWQQHAPWPMLSQVEQDLILSRILVELYQVPEVLNNLAFRGGTALYKLHLKPAARYSEDLDFVQINSSPIGETLDAIRSLLDPWLGTPTRDLKRNRVVLRYRFLPEGQEYPMRVKLEINTDEHFQLYGLQYQDFAVKSRWFSGEAKLCTYHLDELMGTKLRALYQRKKGRDLFDLWYAMQQTDLNIERMIEVFQYYLSQQNQRVTRAQFERNLYEKCHSDFFTGDITPLLRNEITWDFHRAVQVISEQVLTRLPGKEWQGGD